MITYTVQCAYFYPATKSSRCTYTCNLEHKTTAKLDEFSFVINRLPAAAFNWIYIFTHKKKQFIYKQITATQRSSYAVKQAV